MEDYIAIHLNSSEQPTIEASVEHTDKLIYDFNKFAMKKRHKAVWIFFYIVIVIAFVGGFYTMFTGDIADGLISVVIGIIGLGFPSLIMKSSARASNNSIDRQSKHNYKFYREYFAETTCYSIEAVPYSAIEAAYENDAYFFIFIEKNKGFIISKAAFEVNTPFELRKLLKEKLGGKFTVYCKA